MTIHNLKTWPIPFQAMRDGIKTFEIRKNDRGYQVGDQLFLLEYIPGKHSYTGRGIAAKVQWILDGGQFGLAEGYVCMSLCDVSNMDEEF